MKTVLQRVTRAQVTVDGDRIDRIDHIDHGLLARLVRARSVRTLKRDRPRGVPGGLTLEWAR